MRQALLTISIPTYSRSSYLDLCLQRLHQEILNLDILLRNQILIYISDNASKDETLLVINRWKTVWLTDFVVNINVENTGAEANVLHCYQSAKSKYVWVFGDDDVILSGGLLAVIEAIRNEAFDVVYLSGYGFTSEYSDEPRRGRDQRGIIHFSDANLFVKKTNIMLTFITALVVRAGVNLQPVESYTKGTNLPQLGWLFQLIRDGSCFAFVKNRIYAAKIGNTASYGAIDIFGRKLSQIAKSIFSGRVDVIQSLENGTIVLWFPTYLMDMRRGNNAYVQEDMRRDLIELYAGNWRCYMFLVPLIILPMTFARPYFLFLRGFRLVFRSLII
jgi:glycosyltransferase involved in cell wall biosynthesis